MRLIILFISLIFLLPYQDGHHRLTVSVTGLKPLKGDLYISLHNRPEYFQFPDSALMKVKITVNEATETISLKDVPGGRYALALYHDENLNGVLDANELGFPREGYGFSTKNKVPGRPKFEQAAFDISGNDTVEVKMIYHHVAGPKKDTVK
jgi:uncharacterized protein (DUF2141 family)